VTGFAAEKVCFLKHDICVSIQVRFRFGQMSAEMLKEAGAKLEFKAYVGLHHGVNTAEITDMVNFTASVLS